MLRLLKRTLLLAMVALVALLVVVRLRYGGGEPYPDLSQPGLLPESALEVAASFAEPIGNVAVSADDRLFFTVHPESRPTDHRLVEWVDGAARPWPSAEAQRRLFTTVLGVAIDRQQRLWTIDHGLHGVKGARLLAFDLESGEVVHDHRFSAEVAPLGSFLQDLQVSPDGATVVIADASFWRQRPGLVVYDVSRGLARRVLDGHPSVVAQDWLIRTPARTMVFFAGLAALKPAVDGIAMDPFGRWVYWGSMCHDGLYRLALEALLDPGLSPAELATRVERFSDKPLSDGLSADLEGHVFVTDVEHGAVLQVGEDRVLRTLIRSPRVRWADALSFGPGGWLYLADSAIPDMVLRSKAHIDARGPYHVFRFQPGTDGVPGQ